MSTVADWDADVDAEVSAAITASKYASVPTSESVPARCVSDLRRERMGKNAYRYQIRHTHQGADSQLASGARFGVVETEVEIYHRLGVINVGALKVEQEYDYTIEFVVPKIQARLTPASTWAAKDSVHRVVAKPSVSLPEAVSSKVIGFTLSLAVELAP